MTPAQAKEQTDRFRALSRELNDTLRSFMMTGPSGGQFQECKRDVGKVMGELFCQVLDPIWRRYPDLEPPEMRQPDPPEPPMDRLVAERFIAALDGVETGLTSYSALVYASAEECFTNPWDESAIRHAIDGLRQLVARSHPDLVPQGDRATRQA